MREEAEQNLYPHSFVKAASLLGAAHSAAGTFLVPPGLHGGALPERHRLLLVQQPLS